MLQIISTKTAAAWAALEELKKRGMKLIGLPPRKLPMQHGEVTPVETLSRVAEAGTKTTRFIGG